jgi:hypothetical protein
LCEIQPCSIGKPHIDIFNSSIQEKVIKLNETRERLKAAGFSNADAVNPDAKKACSVLNVDSVFETKLIDYSHLNLVAELGSAASLEFSLRIAGRDSSCGEETATEKSRAVVT